MPVPGDGVSSSSSSTKEVGLMGVSLEPTRLTFELDERPLAAERMEAASPLSVPVPSKPAKAEADDLGLAPSLSSVERIFLLTELLMPERLLLSWVSDLEIEGYCFRPSGTKLFDEPLFVGVRVPSLDLD